MKYQSNNQTSQTKKFTTNGSMNPKPVGLQKETYYRKNNYTTEQSTRYKTENKPILASAQQKPAVQTGKVNSPTPRGDLSAGAQAPSLFVKARLSLFTYLLQMKFMSFAQVEKKFGIGKAEIQGLESDGFIKCKPAYSEISPDSLIIPTDLAHAELAKANPNKDLAKPLKRVFEPAIKHDLKLVDLRMRFEELNFVTNWYSEASLDAIPLMKRLFTDMPDAVCKKPNGKSYFLELEISQKTIARYEERINEYTRILENEEVKAAGIEGVIFMCTNDKVLDLIKSKLPGNSSFSALSINRYIKDKAVPA